METQEIEEKPSLEVVQAARAERQEALTDGFIGEGEVKLAGYVLRPFTFGSMTLCRKLKLSLFTDESASELLDDTSTMRQLAAFFWMQSQPVDSVLSAVREGRAEAEIERFEFDIPLHAMPALLRRINELSKLASQAAVDIEPKPDSGDDKAPGN